jgi:hypothetical protein
VPSGIGPYTPTPDQAVRLVRALQRWVIDPPVRAVLVLLARLHQARPKLMQSLRPAPLDVAQHAGTHLSTRSAGQSGGTGGRAPLGSPRGNADTSDAHPFGSNTRLGYTRGRRAGMHRAPVQPQVDELTVGVVDRARWYAAVRTIGRMSRFKKRKLHVEQGGKIALLSVGARVADGRARGRGRARRRAQCEPGCPGTRRTPRGLPVNGTDIESGPLRKRSFGVRLSNTRAALRRAVEEGRPTSLASSAASRERAEIAQCRKRVRPYARTE